MSSIDQEIADLEAKLAAKKAERIGLTSLNKAEALRRVSELVEEVTKNIGQIKMIADQFGLEVHLDSAGIDGYGMGGLMYVGQGAPDWEGSTEESVTAYGSWRNSSSSC